MIHLADLCAPLPRLLDVRTPPGEARDSVDVLDALPGRGDHGLDEMIRLLAGRRAFLRQGD